MKKLLLLAFLFISCKEEVILYKNYDFIVAEKVRLDKYDYFLKSTNDSVLEVSPKQFVKWSEGDTIKMQMVLNGLWKGKHVLSKNQE